jgi:hypothetical protein
MAYKIDKTSGEITIGGWEKGIAASPHMGIANIQNGNISTEQGEVMASFARTQQTTTKNTGTGNIVPHTSADLTFSSVTITAGIWITTGTSTISGLSSTTDYYVLSVSGTTVTLSTTYAGTAISGLGGTGTCTFTIKVNISTPVSSAIEVYNYSGITYHRYYILDENGYLWVNDSQDTVGWRLPYASVPTSPISGMNIAILNGWVVWLNYNKIWFKSTSLLGGVWTAFSGLSSGGMINFYAPHFALVGNQGKLYYTDGNYIGSIFPDSTLISGGVTTTVNVQSYCNYTATTTQGIITTVINGSVPYIPQTTQRVPVVFFTDNTLPSAISAGVTYYLAYDTSTVTYFKAYAAPTGGSALDLQTGAVGNQYFNTFYPISGDGLNTLLYTAQRLNLPSSEQATYMVEIGNTVLIGGKSNILYPWNQISALPSDIISLPESGVVDMINVNNMAYVFAGNKGNIYVTNGANASAVISVPDYCAGIPGTPKTYIEPYFVWGDAMYLRGRIYFSIQDQTATKAGNCGGIWSFVPTQNIFIGQDVGISLRLENQASYGSYNGLTTILIPSQEQNMIAPQYWNGWRNSYDTNTSTLFGIDSTGTAPNAVCVVESDLIPTGTVLNKKTFSQIEYKLSSPLAAGESVAVSYRQNSTDAWTSVGTMIEESTTPLSGYVNVNFQVGQWLQLQVTLTPLTTSSSTFVRLKEIIIR